RIKVIPRSKGDDVIDGVIYIVEDLWNIHSLDIHTTKLGIDIFIKVIYAPIQDEAWLPVSHQFKMEGKVFGFEFEYNYLATVSDYKITVNPDLAVPKMEVIDETIQREEAKAIAEKFDQKKIRKPDNTQQLQERLAKGEEITRKELKTIVKEYEKQERKELDEPEVLSNVDYKIDSGAYTKDSVFWADIRPVPLTIEEVKGYQKADSLAEIERKKEAGDTLKTKHDGFKPWDPILGNNYKVSKHSSIELRPNIPNFNTVEGFNFHYRIGFGTVLQDTNKTRLNVISTFRYAFSREKLTGNLSFNLRNRNYRFKVEGGRYIKQFNPDEPILPIVNTFTTLLLEQNLMKIYERDYVDLLYRRRVNQFLTITTNWSWARRYQLQNSTTYKWVNRSSIEEYSSNVPENEELASTGFATHDAFVGSIGIAARPWLKFRIRNGRKYEIGNSSPTLSLEYRKAFELFDAAVKYDQLEAGIKHSLRLGFRGRLDFNFRGGVFLNNDSLNFMDYKHFLGNRTPFATADPAASFRLLDYYTYSTSDKYFTANVNYQFRKFLITTIPVIRLAGIRENIFVNYLATPTSKNYTEVGYTLDGILRIFRLEAAASFIDGRYLDYGFRIGIATNIAVNFSDN
ncbi:MAG: carboxypeptidase-like regulatory domain-containing protein, partial [Bacteroidia bacterium]|nr:carboxypeptidase-like regulatory domain-containing protein [Bacteroidia bacterium]